MNPEKESRQHPLALGVAIAAGVIAAILRVVPHPPNFSSVGALGLFGGARLPAWKGYAFPMRDVNPDRGPASAPVPST